MSEQRTVGPIVCAHCRNRAPMAVVANYSKIRAHSSNNMQFDWEEGNFWELLECPSCNNVILRKGYYHEYMTDEHGPVYEVLYPLAPESIRGLPNDVKKAFEAATKVKSIDSNAFAVLLGRVLDLVCIERKAKGESLFDRLKDLANRGVMPQQLADMAHSLRHLRNIGAHADLGELTEAEVPILEGLSRAILEYVYSAPALISTVQEKLNALKSKPKPT